MDHYSDVAASGSVEIVKHGRPVAVVLSYPAFSALQAGASRSSAASNWGATHMIPAELARAAVIVRRSAALHKTRWPKIEGQVRQKRETLRRLVSKAGKKRG